VLDRTILNLTSLILGGTGLLAALTEFSVPELRRAYWGENPFQVKRDAIAEAMSWIFGGLAVVALLLQVGAEIWAPDLPERLYTTGSYLRVVAVSLAATAVIVWLATRLGHWIAQRRWRPQVLARHRGMLVSASFILSHDGLAEHQYSEGGRMSADEAERHREHNFEECDKHLAQMEKILDLTPLADRTVRVGRLQRVFAQHDRGLAVPEDE